MPCSAVAAYLVEKLVRNLKKKRKPLLGRPRPASLVAIAPREHERSTDDELFHCPTGERICFAGLLLNDNNVKWEREIHIVSKLE